jgi:hypothetical protein
MTKLIVPFYNSANALKHECHYPVRNLHLTYILKPRHIKKRYINNLVSNSTDRPKIMTWEDEFVKIDVSVIIISTRSRAVRSGFESP